jgi:hypothetical protein
VPVAAYPAPGPVDILTNPRAGVLHHDLGQAIAGALSQGEAGECVALARSYSWERCTEQFRHNLVPAGAEAGITWPPHRHPDRLRV